VKKATITTLESGLIVCSEGYGADVDAMLPKFAEALYTRRQQGGESVDIDVDGLISHVETLRIACGDTRFLKAARALPRYLQIQIFPHGVPDDDEKPDSFMGFLTQ